MACVPLLEFCDLPTVRVICVGAPASEQRGPERQSGHSVVTEGSRLVGAHRDLWWRHSHVRRGHPWIGSVLSTTSWSCGIPVLRHCRFFHFETTVFQMSVVRWFFVVVFVFFNFLAHRYFFYNSFHEIKCSFFKNSVILLVLSNEEVFIFALCHETSMHQQVLGRAPGL